MNMLRNVGLTGSVTLVIGLRRDANCPVGTVCWIANLLQFVVGKAIHLNVRFIQSEHSDSSRCDSLPRLCSSLPEAHAKKNETRGNIFL